MANGNGSSGFLGVIVGAIVVIVVAIVAMSQLGSDPRQPSPVDVNLRVPKSQ